MEIRKAVLADEEAVCSLWALLLEQYQKEAQPAVLQRAYRFVMDNPRRVQVFVVLMKGHVAGTASLHLGHFSTWNNNFYGHIEDLFVHPRWRGQGVAYHLLRHVIGVAGRENLARLELTTQRHNRAARKLYEKLGFTTSSVVYELQLN